MAKGNFTLMDFVKKQGLNNIQGVFGEECLNEDGTVMSLADQAAVIDALRKSNVAMMLQLLSDEVDVSEFNPHNFGVGYNELRYFSIDIEGNPVFESNNVHDWERDDDAYKVFVWEDLTDYEKSAIEEILKQIVKQKLAA